MKVLLVYANQFQLLAPPPVGLAVMLNPLRTAGHEVRIIDFMRERIPTRCSSGSWRNSVQSEAVRPGTR